MVLPLRPQSPRQRALSKTLHLLFPTAPALWRPTCLCQGGQTPVAVVAIVPCCCHPTPPMPTACLAPTANPSKPWMEQEHPCRHGDEVSPITLHWCQATWDTIKPAWATKLPPCPVLPPLCHPPAQRLLQSLAPITELTLLSAVHEARRLSGSAVWMGGISPHPRFEVLSPCLTPPTPAWGCGRLSTPAPLHTLCLHPSSGVWPALMGKRTKSLSCRAGHGRGSGGSGAEHRAEPLAHASASGCGFLEDAALSLQGDALSRAISDAVILPALLAALGL